MGGGVRRRRGLSALERDRQTGAQAKSVFLGVQTQGWVIAGRLGEEGTIQRFGENCLLLIVRTGNQEIGTGAIESTKIEIVYSMIIAHVLLNFMTTF